MFGILPCLAVILTDAQVLPIDDANCKDTFFIPKLKTYGILAQ